MDESIPYEALANPAVHSTNADGGSPFLDSIRDLGKKLGAAVVEEKKPDTTPAVEASAKPAEAKPAESKVEPAKPSTKDPLSIPELTKTEAKPADDVPAAIKSTKAAEEWKKLKAERDTLKAELEKAKTAPAPAKPETEYQNRIQQLEAENKDFSEKLRLLDIERHPEFQKKYNSRIEATHELIKVSAGENGELLSKLLRVPQSDQRDAQIDRIVGELPPSKQAKVGALMARIEEINTERNAELADAKTKYESVVKMRQDEEINARQAAKAEAEKIWAKTAATARALEVFEPKDGDEAWNSEVNQRLELAQRIFGGENSEEDLAKAALWAVAAPKYRELLHAQIAINGKLTAELAKLRGADAKVQTSTGTKAGASNAQEAAGDSFMDAFKKVYNPRG